MFLLFDLIFFLPLAVILILLAFDSDFFVVQRSSEYMAALLFILVNFLFLLVADVDFFDVMFSSFFSSDGLLLSWSVLSDWFFLDVLEERYTPEISPLLYRDSLLLSYEQKFLFGSLFSSFFSSFFQLDVLSISLIWLSAFLLYLCVSLNWTSFFYKRDYYLSFYYVSLFLIFWLLFCAFSVSNIFWFYIFFEASLGPLVFLIGAFGSRQGAKLQASYKLYFFTLLASFPLLLVIILLYFLVGSLHYSILRSWVFFDFLLENIFWWSFFLAFAVKLPIVPLHLWLPEAHVEAPTGGSILLAGILLKLGAYGMIRFLIPFFPEATEFNSNLVLTIAILTAVIASLISMVQLDLKRVIAYSSVSHMAFVLFGLFSDDFVGFLGAINLLYSHGLVSSALFLLVGFFYDRTKTRVLFYNQSLTSFSPTFSFYIFVLSLANIALPGNYSFISEVLVLLSGSYSVIYFIAAFITFFASVYTLRPLLTILFGPVPSIYRAYSDLDDREFSLILFLFFGVLLFGIFPDLITFLFKEFVL